MGEITGLKVQQRLMRLQLNNRVFFGVNHSVHIDCTKLVMEKFTLPLVSKTTSGHMLTDVPSAAGVAEKLIATETEWLMPLPSSELGPLLLCRELRSISVTGPQITDLEFLTDLPDLAEVSIHGAKVRDLAPLATLSTLRSLSITDLSLEGGAEVDICTRTLAHSHTQKRNMFTQTFKQTNKNKTCAN